MLSESKLSFGYQQELCNRVLRFFRAAPVPPTGVASRCVPKFWRLHVRGFVSTLCLIALLLTAATAQTTPPAAKKSPAPASPTASSAPATTGSKAAVTIDRVCPPGTPGGKAFNATCKTVITESEMDKLIAALNPEMSATVRQQLGRSIAELTAYAAKARELGLEKTPEFAELLRFTRMQILAQALAHEVQKKAENISPAEMQAYYDAHKSDFEEFNFLRVIIPREAPAKDKPVDEAAETQFAQQIHDRLVKGEDAKALQTEAFKHSGQGATEPPVEINGRKRGSMPPSQASIFDMKPGEVSAVFPDPGAFFLYKLVSRSITPFDKASTEVKKAIAKERLEKAVKDLNAQFEVKLSESYFGPESEGPPRGAPSMRGPGGSAPPQPPASTPKTPAPAEPQVPKQ
jgi:parvulin-like peptidyl-prolyl isomerase